MSADHVLTDAERSAGILTPEVMWKIKRVGSAVLSPDGRTVLYTVTTYDMKENKGVTNIRSAPVSGGKWIRVTDPGSNESSPQWSADGRTIYFISDHGGSDQVWCAAPDGNNRRQVTDIPGGVEGFSVAPSENRLMYVARVPVEKRSSPEIYPDLDRSKAKIYDVPCWHWAARVSSAWCPMLRRNWCITAVRLSLTEIPPRPALCSWKCCRWRRLCSAR